MIIREEPILGILSQRLTLKLCDNCTKPQKIGL